jgi:class 3 adenylate cyclase/tetratricopeptide (TPR) repeat protein
MRPETRGETLPSRCLRCREGNPPFARFCNHCGAPLSPSATRSALGGDTERRQITVMFADLVDSTALIHQLDEEDFGDLIREYWGICDEVVAEFGSRISQHLGDGVMAYFGHPKAYEDDPRRATQAALRIIERTRFINDRLQLDLRISPEVRIGIHTGMTVIGPTGLALGEAPSLAARLEKFAQPNSIVISDATRNLIEGYFHLESLGRQTLKGFAEPVGVHRVLSATVAQSRMEVTASRLTPLAGRDQEDAELARLWSEATTGGAPRVVVVSGESGIGKSRLAQTLKDRLTDGCAALEGYCSHLRQNAVLNPIAQMLEMASGIGSAPDPVTKSARFEAFVLQMDLDGEAVSLLAPVLGLSLLAKPGAAVLTPGVRRQRTMKFLVAFFRALAARRPLLLIIEDLHWSDASTIEFLEVLINTEVREPLMVLATCRPELDVRWGAPAVETIELQHLPRQFAEQIIDCVTMGRTLPDGVRDRIISLADGIPLYLEEVARASLEGLDLPSDGRPAGRSGDAVEVLIPPAVRDLLAAHLDRLGGSKPIAQLAAILGREFSYDVMRTVGLMDEAELNAGLRHLTESGLLIAEERGARRTYRFRHSLIQEVAYQSLLKSRRRQYHHRIASVLLDQFPEISDRQPDVIARHYAKANLPKLASIYFERAGAAAFGAQAYVESTSHLRSALEQIEKLPPGEDRDSRELSALAALGLPLLMTQGYAAPDVEATYERAMKLTTDLNTPVRILFGVWGAQLVRGSTQNTERMALQFRHIAETSRSRAEKLIAWAAIGSHAFWRGDFQRAISALGAAVSEFEPEMLVSLPRDYGHDNALFGHLYLAWAQQTSGQFVEGRATWEQAWAITEEARSPYLAALALSFGAAMARDVGELDRALELSERGMALSSEHQLAFWQALARIQHGSALCLDAKLDRGTALIEQGLQFSRAIGVKTPLAYYLAYLAEAYWLSGATQKGLEVVEEGLELADTHVDRNSLAELLRLKAELLIQRGGSRDIVELAFRRSLEVARAQGAGLWELRSATGFAAMLRDKGEAVEAVGALDRVLAQIGAGEPPVVSAARRLRVAIAGTVAGGLMLGLAPRLEAAG